MIKAGSLRFEHVKVLDRLGDIISVEEDVTNVPRSPCGQPSLKHSRLYSVFSVSAKTCAFTYIRVLIL